MSRLRNEATVWGLTLVAFMTIIVVYTLLFRIVHGAWPHVQ